MRDRQGAGECELLRATPADPEAFAVFYERHAVAVDRWLLRQTGDRSAAADLTAETFAQALAGAHRFRGKEDREAMGWLFGIARNLVARYWRDSQVEIAARVKVGMQIREYEFDDNERLSGGDLCERQLEHALAVLSEEQRQALSLRVVEELSYDEVAERLDCTSPTARARVSRALRTLAELIRA